MGASQPAFLRVVFAEFDREAAWPSVNVLQKRLVRKGERLNVSEAVYGLPHDLGHLESLAPPAQPAEQEIVLSLLALRYVDEARGLLESFFEFLRLVVGRYADAEDRVEVIVRRADLIEGLGLSESETTKLSHVLLRGGVRFLGGGISDTETWERRIHEPALVPFLDVHDIDSYLSIEASILLGRAGPVRSLTSNTSLLGRPAGFAVGGPAAGFHEAIEQAAVPLFESGHYAEAVEKSYKVVRDRLRELTGYETGSEAFGKDKLRISGAAAPHVADDFNEGVKFLTMAIDKFRNEKSHSSDGNISDHDRARE